MTKSELNDALPILAQIDYSAVPKDNLAKYMKDVFKSAEVIINSIPNAASSGSPPSPPASPNTAKKPEDTVCSPHPDNEIDARHADIQSAWGKPIKNPAKDNPLDITVYKMSGNDKRGAWFARRSIHQNLGFTRWKKMMQKEFATSMAQTGGPGTGAVRGIAADKRLEKEEVEGVGKLEGKLASSPEAMLIDVALSLPSLGYLWPHNCQGVRCSHSHFRQRPKRSFGSESYRQTTTTLPGGVTTHVTPRGCSTR
jgi:hypothetical protein